MRRPFRASRISLPFEGVRENQLVGYGLVTGLNGTGDTLNNCPMTRQSMQAMMERLGVNTRGANIRTANIAAVMVTANLPAFSTQGTRLDVTVSALCDAKSLQGAPCSRPRFWVLMARFMRWRRARLPFPASQPRVDAAKITRGVPTVGRIANGALIEREVDFQLNKLQNLRLALRNPDLTPPVASRRRSMIFLGADTAEPTDPSTVVVQVPRAFPGNMVRLLTE